MNMPALSLTRDNVSPSRAKHESRSGAAQKRFRDGRVTVGHRGSAMWAIEQTQLSADTQGQWQASTAEFADIYLDAFVLDAANVAGDTYFFLAAGLLKARLLRARHAPARGGQFCRWSRCPGGNKYESYLSVQ